MNIYLLTRTDDQGGWDIYTGMVVIHEDEASAKTLSQHHAGVPRPAEVWPLDDNLISAEIIGETFPLKAPVKPRVVLADFKYA
jgi:hypothetical protein